jgi:hypothetical protein
MKIYTVLTSLLLLTSIAYAETQSIEIKTNSSTKTSAINNQKGKLVKIAVTDLTYQEKLSQYFSYTSYSNKSSTKASASNQYKESVNHSSDKSRANFSDSSETKYENSQGYVTYIDRGELRKFSADIKGELIKSGHFKVTQAKPYTSTKNSEEIFDIIKRIKGGYYPGADYVLFGTLSNIEFVNQEAPVQGSDATTKIYGLELVADFSLINTKTYEVNAAFSATGEGQDMKLVKPGNVLNPSRTKMISETSKSLGEDVISQILEQMNLSERENYVDEKYESSNSSSRIVETYN